MEKFNKIWKDPVWSKVISAAIITLIIFLYNKWFGSFWEIQMRLWQAIVATIIILIATKYFDKKRRFVYDDKMLELDVALFDKIRNELLTQTNVYWLRTNNFAGYSFNDDYLQPFDMLEFVMDKPDFEFFNPNLDNLKSELMNEIRELNSFMSGNIFNAGNNRMTVPPEWEDEQPKRFDAAVNGIQTRAQSIGNKYDNFIRIGRKILKVA